MKHSSYLHPTTKNILFQKRIINYISVIPKKTHTLHETVVWKYLSIYIIGKRDSNPLV